MRFSWTSVLGVIALIGALYGIRYLRSFGRRSRDKAASQAEKCARCGYTTAGLSMPRCPECGALRGFKVPLHALGLTEEEIRTGFAESARRRSGADQADAIRTRAAEARDRAWASVLVAARWGDSRIVSRGRVHDAADLPAIVAERAGQQLGLATYVIESDRCELVTLDAIAERTGVGSALLAAVERTAREAGCARVTVITSNDNLAALRFYQKRAYRIIGVHVDAITRARAIKPAIPTVGGDGIPIQDEIELEKRLEAN